MKTDAGGCAVTFAAMAAGAFAIVAAAVGLRAQRPAKVIRAKAGR